MPELQNLLVAITGGIGSGKSTFSNYLTELGHIVLYADEISKDILANDPKVRNEIVRVFGAKAYSNNIVNKKYLADTVFSNPIKLKKINSILHPRVREKIISLAKEYFKTRRIVFVEAALIYESKIEKMYDLVVLIYTDKKLRLERSVRGSKITQNDFKKRNENQLDDTIKMKRADIVFSNNGSKAELKQKAHLLSLMLNRR